MAPLRGILLILAAFSVLTIMSAFVKAASATVPTGEVVFFRAALSHEERVTEAIGELYKLAQAEGDIRAIPLLTRGAAPDIMRKVRARGRLNRSK